MWLKTDRVLALIVNAYQCTDTKPELGHIGLQAESSQR